MTNREREIITLSFGAPADRGSVEETFYPWSLTVDKFRNEGLLPDIAQGLTDIVNEPTPEHIEREKYFNVQWGAGILNFETRLGFDPVRRIGFTLPFRRLDEVVLEESVDYLVKKDITGRTIKYHKHSGLVEALRPVVCAADDWKKLKEHGNRELEKHFTRDNIRKAYMPLREGHEKGDYPIRLNLEGFFWTPRELFGIEPHMYAYYDVPELIHEINEYILSVYMEKLTMVLEILPADVVYIMEDLSGKNGPLISPGLFDEFVGSYYQRLIPELKKRGVKNVFVDTDGNFTKLIPNFIKAGVDGFLPMDVNAGIDIVDVRAKYPNLKFIGGFNKLCIAAGKKEIDMEFDRILPVIRQGGYIPGCDHQVAPETTFANYQYYIGMLKKVMS